MVELFANSGNSDQTSRCVASDLGLYCLPVTDLGVSSLPSFEVCTFFYHSICNYMCRCYYKMQTCEKGPYAICELQMARLACRSVQYALSIFSLFSWNIINLQ